MKLQIEHRTVFSYSAPLRHAVQRVHLRPQSGPTQRVLNWQLQAPGRCISATDGLGNAVDTFNVSAEARVSVVTAWGGVESLAVHDFVQPLGISPLYFVGSSGHGASLADPHPRMSDWARRQVRGHGATPEDVLDLATAVAERVRYRSGQTGVQTDALEAFDWGWGVCQDQAHVMVALCRGLGWPARYVSGYFDDPHAPELASHAWVDVCIDAMARRWLSVDVTHACFTDERHVRLAVGRDYAQCSPTRGVRLGGGHEDMHVSVDIVRL